jgi:hypothetical protein
MMKMGISYTLYVLLISSVALSSAFQMQVLFEFMFLKLQM